MLSSVISIVIFEYYCPISVEYIPFPSHNMYVMDNDSILNHSKSLCQDGVETIHLQNGLRVLANIISRDILRKRSSSKNKVSLSTDTKSKHDEP